jgi:hypothetical protein
MPRVPRVPRRLGRMTDLGSETTSTEFDVSLEAEILAERNGEMYRGAQLVLLGSAATIGPILGFFFLTKLFGTLGGAIAGLVLGMVVMGSWAFFLVGKGGPYANQVTIRDGYLRYALPGKFSRQINLRNAWTSWSSIRIIAFSTAFPLPQPYPPLAGSIKYVPLLDRGTSVLVPLSPAAAEAVKREMVRLGWHPVENDVPMGALHAVNIRFRRQPRQSGT